VIIGIAGSLPRIQRAIEQLGAGQSSPHQSSGRNQRPWPGHEGELMSFGSLGPDGIYYEHTRQPNHPPQPGSSREPPVAPVAQSHTQAPTRFGGHPAGGVLMHSLYYPASGPSGPNSNVPN
jgi:hypothetical protein